MEWNEEFLSQPSDLIKVNDGDHSGEDSGDKCLRELKEAFSERFSSEHNIDDGKHLAGKSSVVFVGTTLEIGELYDIPSNSISYDTDLKCFKVYDGTSWVSKLGNHSNITNLLLDNHLQYLNLDKPNQEISTNLSMILGKSIDGRVLSTDFNRIKSWGRKTTGKVNLSFIGSSKEIRRTIGSFIADGFSAYDVVYSTSGLNPGPFVISSISTTYLTTFESLVSQDVEETLFVKRRGFLNDTTTLSVNTIYGPEISDIIIYVNYTTTAAITINVYSGTTSPPSELVYKKYIPAAFWIPIRRGNYWRVDASSGTWYIHRIRVYS